MKASYKFFGIFALIIGIVVAARYFDLTEQTLQIASRLGVAAALTDADLSNLELKELSIALNGAMAFLDSEPGLMNFDDVRDHILSITPKRYMLLIVTVFDIVEQDNEFIESKTDNLASKRLLYLALKEAAWVVGERESLVVDQKFYNE